MSDTDPESDSLDNTPTLVDSIIQDDSEDEVFFGNVSEKEKYGINSKFNRRRTLTISDSDRRRSFEVPQVGNRSGSKGRFSLQDSVGSISSYLAVEQSLVEKHGMDDVFTFNESLGQESSSQGNKDNASNLELEGNMEVSGQIILSKNEMFEHKMVQNNSEIDYTINNKYHEKPCNTDFENDLAQPSVAENNVSLEKQITHEEENNLANKYIFKSKPSVHNESLSTDSHENIHHDALQSSIESSPADSFQSEVEEKLTVSENFSSCGSDSIFEGSMSTYIVLPVPNENRTAESSETITKESLATNLPVISENSYKLATNFPVIGENSSTTLEGIATKLPVIGENSSTDGPQLTLEEKSSSGSSIAMSERLSTDSGSIIKERSSSDGCSSPEVPQPIPKESSSTTSHLHISSESSFIDNDQVFSEDRVAPNSTAPISGKVSSPDRSEPLLKEKVFTNPPLGEFNNGPSSNCPRPAFIERMSTDFVPPLSGEIVSTDEVQQGIEGDSTDPSCSISNKDVSIDGFQLNPDESLSTDTVQPVSSESLPTNESQPNDQGSLSNNISFQENFSTDCATPAPCESLTTDNFQPKGEEIVCTDTHSKSVVEESLSTEEVPSVSSESLPTNESQSNDQGSLSNNVSFQKIVEENLSTDCAPPAPCGSLPTDNFQPIGDKEIEEVPSVSSEGLPTDGFQPVGEESLSTDFLPTISNESLSSNELPPVISVYLTDSDPFDTSRSNLAITSEDSQSPNKENFLFNSSKPIPDQSLPIDRSPMPTSHSTNDLQLEINDVTQPSNDTQDSLPAQNIDCVEQSNGLSCTTLNISSKMSNSFGSTLEIERNGSHSVTNQLKVSGTSFSDISRSSQSGTAAGFIETLEEPSAATNSSSLSFSEKSLLVSNCLNNFLSSTSDGRNLSSPNTIAFGLSPESRERMYSLMDDSNAALSCADTVFSDDSCDGFAEDESFKQSDHSEDEVTDSLAQNEQGEVNVNDSVAHSEHVEEATGDNYSFAQLGSTDNSKKGDITVDKAFSTVAVSSLDIEHNLEEINNDKNSNDDGITQSDNLNKKKRFENISHEELQDSEENKDGECLIGDSLDSESGTAIHSNDDGENCLEEILDVDNDQLFDDTLFSMNDDNSRRLSTIGKKICQKWKKKEKKATRKNESPCAIEDNNENFCILKGNLNTISKTSPNLRGSTLAEDAPQFDNTADEMALYEMFGHDYDKTVDEMTVGEKKELRENLDSRTEEDLQLTRSNLSILMDVSLTTDSEADTDLHNSILMDVSLPVSPDLHNACLDVNKSVTTVDTDNFTNELVLHKKSPSQEKNILIEKNCFLQPDFLSKTITKSPTDPQSIVASHHTRVTPSSSTSNSSPWRSASPMRKSFIPTPINSGPRTRTPQLSGSAVRTPGSSANTKVGAARCCQVDVHPSPLLGAHLRPGVGVSPSPLATYLRDNKPPPLVHQVKAQSAVRDLESTLTEVDNETAEYACPLPEAVYIAHSLAKEHITDATNKDYNIAEAYGQTNTLATVTRHVGRVKTAGIHWGEELATDQSLMSSPSQCQMLPVGKSVLKKTQRDSGTFDESMVDMSVLETVAIKKIGRGKNKRNK